MSKKVFIVGSGRPFMSIIILSTGRKTKKSNNAFRKRACALEKV